jgi:uncharacterized protein (DUF952 family)
MRPDIIYHIVDKRAWKDNARSGAYQPSTVETEGFIHCSTASELQNTANRFFKGKSGLLLVLISTGQVRAEIKFEQSGDHGIFPHIYGSLNLDAVLDTISLIPEPDGTFNVNVVEEN